ncbi:Peptidyl-tRNA hydrolase II (PTH2) family protein [Striga hermonthica]|uniref:peptidyl-tRNA hydrolase n=1 Tax=Striga hermonthica TaxID=68872 RepID=A0A9N7R613_STRHE|nr:Peptidyl-tRNA hydrolase II (PTH2) family protein [Striga hermonthica]
MQQIQTRHVNTQDSSISLKLSPEKTSTRRNSIRLLELEKGFAELFISMQGAALELDMVGMAWFSALLIGAGCFAIGLLFGSRRSSRSSALFPTNAEIDGDSRKKNARSKQPLEVEKLADIIEDFKMVLVVRNDLKMGKGKIAAQCSHATLGLYKKILNRAPKSLNRWEMCGQVKVVVKIESEDDMLVLQERAKSLNLPTHITVDAGRTQIAPNSRTVMAILGPADLVDDVTGGLKLL